MRELVLALSEANAALGSERRIFSFEADFARDLRCIPMVVRFKLDSCGIKLSLRQWSRFGDEVRASLLVQRCDTPCEVTAYSQRLVEHIEETKCGPVVWLDVDQAPAWANKHEVPLQVLHQAERIGLTPPTVRQWERLATIERFALLKLARSDHDNDNFLPAMKEFGLKPDR